MASDTVRRAIRAKAIDGKAIVIDGIHGRTTLRLLGATMTTNVSLTHTYERENVIILYPNKGEEGLVAVVINAFDGWTGGKHNQPQVHHIPAFLKVTWTNEGSDIKPRVALESPWFPVDRIGTIRMQPHIESLEVAFKGKRFSSLHPSYAPRKRDTGCDISYGLDGSLLCRYLWGTASPVDVLHAAVQAKVEPLATERVEQMTREIAHLNHQIQSLEASNTILRDRFYDAVGQSNELRKVLQRIPRWLRPKSADELIAATES